MYDLSQAGYSESEVFDLLRSDRTVYYRYDLLSRNDIPIGNVTATGTINCDATATIKRVASLNIKEANDIDFLNEKIKPYMCLETSRGMLQFPLGVFLMSSPSRTGGTSEREVDCYDKHRFYVMTNLLHATESQKEQTMWQQLELYCKVQGLFNTT